MQSKVHQMDSRFRFICLVILSCSINDVVSKDAALETVSKHGQLSVDGLHLVDQYGEQVQLKGMSLFWSIWYPNFYNEATVKGVHLSCHSNVIRPALAVDTNDGGYLRDPQGQMALVDAVVEAAIREDIYVLVDWQEADSNIHLVEARQFYDQLSKKYGHYPNIIYEPFNEPVNQSWSYVLKPYFEEIIKTIRANDPDNLIMIGSPNWSTQLDLPAADPITIDKNIMYSMHWYAGTHTQWLRDIAEAALDKGLPIFVTEYGTVDSDGDGPVYLEETRKWWDWLDARNMSYLNWSISDKAEGASALVPGTTANQTCQADHLTESGRLVVSQNMK